MSRREALRAEAVRQLRICDACRYCEGYCAVFPALERRSPEIEGSVDYLANLCHDCRACYYACMYAPPHEFAVNIPRILQDARLAGYDEFVSRRAPHRPLLRGRWVVPAAALGLISLLVATVSAASVGLGAFWRHGHGAASPYQSLPYPALLVLAGIPTLWGVAILARANVRYWRATGGLRGASVRPAALYRALRDAAVLANLRGGGGECFYPDERPSPLRRRLHAAVAYGFVLCFASTVSAAVEQDLLGVQPPYGLSSVPVLLGLVGGVALVVGCAGLIWLKLRSDPAPESVAMAVRDYGLLFWLGLLSASGLAVLGLRWSTVAGAAFLVHLAVVLTAFVLAPYTKFAHVGYRVLALVQDAAERAGRRSAPAPAPGGGRPA
jgi:citrate/tricarballylate utilization protein